MEMYKIMVSTLILIFIVIMVLGYHDGTRW